MILLGVATNQKDILREEKLRTVSPSSSSGVKREMKIHLFGELLILREESQYEVLRRAERTVGRRER